MLNSKSSESDIVKNKEKDELIHGLLLIRNFRNVRFQLEENLSIIIHGFWSDNISKECQIDKKINILEHFSLVPDKLFLEKVRNNHLSVELHQKNNYIVGIAKLPVHQFFIAFKDSEITNRLFQELLPVISIDDWVPVINPVSKDCCGYLQSMLAMGTCEQITRLKERRGLLSSFTSSDCSQLKNSNNFSKIFNVQQPVFENLSKQKYNGISSSNLGNFIENLIQQRNLNSLTANNNEIKDKAIEVSSKQQVRMRKTSDLLDALNKALAIPPTCENEMSSFYQFDPFNSSHLELSKTCKISINIERAVDLPRNTMKIGSKKISKRSPAAANDGETKRKQPRIPAEEEPSAYVTFHAQAGYGQMVKSHEGFVYATNVIEKTCNPVWDEKFEVPVPIELFTNNEKRLILKVWRKVSTDLAHCQLQPLPMEDVVIGFLAIDFNKLSKEYHISEWYNIIDHNGRRHGRLKLKIKAIEDLDDMKRQVKESNSQNAINWNFNNADFGNTPLSRAIKRKFTELEEITERLKARLLGVTGNLESDEDVIQDPHLEAQLDEFEHDLNTICDEDEGDENYEDCSNWLEESKEAVRNFNDQADNQ